MKKTITIFNIETLKGYIRSLHKGGLSHMSIEIGVTLPKLRDVLEERTKNIQTIKSICSYLEIDYKDIEEWKKLVDK